MDEKAGHMQTYEQAQPEQYEYYRQNEEHLIPSFSMQDAVLCVADYKGKSADAGKSLLQRKKLQLT